MTWRKTRSDKTLSDRSGVLQVIDWDKESPPLTQGPRRMHYQFSVTLPQIHLTFVSILQGIALYVLLVNLPLPTGTTLQGVLTFVGDQHAYLAYLISLLVILEIWKEFVEATMFFLWPLTPVQLGLVLLISAVEIVAFREVDNLGAWFLCLGLVGIIGGVIRLNNLRLRKTEDYESPRAERSSTKAEKASGSLYIVLGLLIIAADIAVPLLPRYAANRGAVAWAALGIMAIIMVVVIPLNHHLIMGTTMKELVRGSDLDASEAGRLRYCPPGEQPKRKQSDYGLSEDKRDVRAADKAPE